MFLYFLRNATRYIFVPVEGPVISFDYPGSGQASMTVDTISETRLAKLTWSAVQLKHSKRANSFGGEMAELLAKYAPGEKRVAVDRLTVSVARALEAAGLEPIECQEDLIRLRMVKMPQEIACLKLSMMATELAVHAVRDAIRPGISEQKLFGLMMGKLIEEGGDFIKTHLLSAGYRTNPWFTEANVGTLDSSVVTRQMGVKEVSNDGKRLLGLRKIRIQDEAMSEAVPQVKI